jgi:SPP1 gp7 family putative phage head morphogenesis protein
MMRSIRLRNEAWASAELTAFKRALRLFRDPDRPRNDLLQNLYANIMLDAHLASVCNTRRIRVLGEAFVVRKRDTAEVDEERTRLFNTPWFYQLVQAALDARLYGYTLLEITGLDEDGEIAELRPLPRQHVLPQKHLLLRTPGDQQGIDYTKPPWDVWAIPIGEQADAGLLEKALPEIVWMRAATEAWDEYTALFGVPLIHATTSERDSKELARIDQFLEQFRNASWARFPEGTEVSIMESEATDASKVFLENITLRQKRISKLILGVTMLTDEGASLSQSQVHERLADDYLRADLRYIQDFVNWHLWWRLQALGYDLDGYEFIYTQFADTVDLQAQIQIDKTIADMGFELDAQYLEQTYGTKIKGIKQQGAAFAAHTPPSAAGGEELGGGHHHGGLRAAPGKQPPSPSGEGLGAVSALGAMGHPCCGHHLMAALPDEGAFADKWQALMDRLWQDKALDIPADFFLYYAQTLQQGFERGYNVEPDYDSPDNQRIAAFHANIYYFSAASTYEQALELKALAGQSRDFADFKARVEAAGFEVQRRNWLQAEYNHTIAASQNAANWFRQQADKDLFDLQYRAVLDDRTRSEHAALNGLTARADDPVWSTIYPPNGWNCRCEVIQVAALPGREDIKLDSALVNQAVKPDFRFNFGQENQIFNAARTRVLQNYDIGRTGWRKYGLDDWAQLDRSSLPKPALGNNSKDAFRQWWAVQAVAQGRNSQDLYFPSYQQTWIKAERRHLIDHFDNAKPAENRWAMAPLVNQILAQPDEVWFDRDIKPKTLYLKNYNEGTYAVVVTEGEIATWYPVLEQKISEIRKGVLLKK